MELKGEHHWMPWSNGALDGGRLVYTRQDIIEYRKAEEGFQKNITLLQRAEALAAVGSWEYDIVTGRFRWSEGMCKMLELGPGTGATPDIYMCKWALPKTSRWHWKWRLKYAPAPHPLTKRFA